MKPWVKRNKGRCFVCGNNKAPTHATPALWPHMPHAPFCPTFVGTFVRGHFVPGMLPGSICRFLNRTFRFKENAWFLLDAAVFLLAAAFLRQCSFYLFCVYFVARIPLLFLFLQKQKQKQKQLRWVSAAERGYFLILFRWVKVPLLLLWDLSFVRPFLPSAQVSSPFFGSFFLSLFLFFSFSLCLVFFFWGGSSEVLGRSRGVFTSVNCVFPGLWRKLQVHTKNLGDRGHRSNSPWFRMCFMPHCAGARWIFVYYYYYY